MKLYRDFLAERRLQFNNDKRYGQIIFLAGGAASGKGFAVSNYLPSSDYKIRDVDEMKKSYMELGKLKGKFPEIAHLNLGVPEDVFKLHEFVKKRGYEKRSLHGLLWGAKNPATLPNIIFDITLKEPSKVTKLMPALLAAGYKTENIHLVWILQNYTAAVVANTERERVVPLDIQLQTHQGAAMTVLDAIGGHNTLIGKNMINGDVYTILNNQELTIFYKSGDTKTSRRGGADGDSVKSKNKGGFAALHREIATDSDGNMLDSKGKILKDQLVVKDFTSLKLKSSGKPFETDITKTKGYQKLVDWAVKNAPIPTQYKKDNEI